MVIHVFKGAANTTGHYSTELRRIVKDAEYEPETLSVGSGAENRDAGRLVCFIKGLTIGADRYPLSHIVRPRIRNIDIEIWENEGASLRER